MWLPGMYTTVVVCCYYELTCSLSSSWNINILNIFCPLSTVLTDSFIAPKHKYSFLVWTNKDFLILYVIPYDFSLFRVSSKTYKCYLK